MARPRKFDENTVLDSAVLCFWSRGYEATSIRNLEEKTGLNTASLYNAFGDKRAIYEKALRHYLERNLADRIRSFGALSPRDAIAAFFEGIVKRSLGDRERKGCMLVNAALEVAPHDPGLRKIVIEVFAEIEAFFLVHVRAGQANGTVTRCLPATTLARHLLGVLMGIRVLARVRPEQDLLESVVAASLALLGNGESRWRSR